MKKISKTLDRALGCAAEYRRHVERGDAVMAEQTRRTIEDLVGCPMRSGEVRLPECVSATMRGEEVAS